MVNLNHYTDQDSPVDMLLGPKVVLRKLEKGPYPIVLFHFLRDGWTPVAFFSADEIQEAINDFIEKVS